ncbi:PREDICTED: protein EFFECTOR OF TRANSCRIPTION 2-like isoform X2 [Nicotiana attenuata]|uniref:Protein effector of transcription 2 n=1 Tax=Nicotiana attenuata TaxID=49451 RepID=A0A1J6IP26_NICAT|nr:PREDICTED: protein EFFECTOR OF TRANSCRIPTION 2-like isoform X2 [Nicotiana attenuata]OIT02304.1 protein effector of transcription 2 [Nicotiana attenuata]
MGDTHRSITVRLKREDCKRTKHDSAFSDWKILIGPNDWTDYLLRKEGAEKYRTQNLPNCTSCSGVYELGIAVTRHQAGREASRLDPDYIVPVYVGKSDNVRTRLQRYGREGAHLENGCSNSALHDQVNVSASKRAGLFTEAFSRGFSIVYRWAPMNDNKDAEKTEAQLLDRFDYAWNKGSNGVRCHNDVLRKLDGVSRATRLPAFVRKLQLSLEKQKGVRIQACKPLLLENGDDFHDTFKSTYFLPEIVKFGRSQPRIVSLSSCVNNDPNNICGVALGHGSVCIRPPITGNKRCAEHKGMKVNGVEHKGMRVKKPISEQLGKIPSVFAGPATKISSEKMHWNIDIPSVNHSPACGATSLNGSFCRRKLSEGNKRCWQHKGAEIPSVFAGPSVNHSPACGATLLNGSFCRRKPSEGNKRCWQHKGRKS